MTMRRPMNSRNAVMRLERICSELGDVYLRMPKGIKLANPHVLGEASLLIRKAADEIFSQWFKKNGQYP